MIKIIASGKIKEQYLILLIDDYLKRIKKYTNIEIIEIKDENDLKKESVSILNNIKPREYIIVLDILGENLTSLELAKRIDNIYLTNSTITFIIGSSLGIHEDIKKQAHLLLSFSKLTFPHGLFRGILLEQIYRTFKILNNESYHK